MKGTVMGQVVINIVKHPVVVGLGKVAAQAVAAEVARRLTERKAV